MSLLIIFVLCYGTLAQLNDNSTLYQRCVTYPLPVGTLCFQVTSNDCLDLTGIVTLNSMTVMGPRSIPIGRLLGPIQKQLGEQDLGQQRMCQSLPINGIDCYACSTITDLNINGDNLHVCGGLSVNCSILGVTYERQLPPSCIDLRDCKTYGCQNNCSGFGQCTSFGLCRCSRGHYGFDCSIEIKNNCFSSATTPKTCWNIDFPDCNTVRYQVDTSAASKITQTIQLNSGSSLQLVPCQKFNNPTLNNMNCEMCVEANSLRVEVDKLIGCPSVIVNCNKREVSNTQLDCTTLAPYPNLRCPNTNTGDTSKVWNSTSPLGTQSTAKTILVAMSAILGIAILGVSGYLIATKVIGLDGVTPFQRVDSYLTEDIEPLNREEESSVGTHGEV